MNYVYYFTDHQNHIIYVGKTGNIKNRMRTHFTKGHLPKECYQSVNQIFFAESGGQYDTEIIETILIDKYKPLYNTDKFFLERYERSHFALPELKWKELFVRYENRSVEIYFSNPGYACFDCNRSEFQRVRDVVGYNLDLLRYRQSTFTYTLKNILSVYGCDLLKFLFQLCLCMQLHPEYSSIDEPLDPEAYHAAYAAFSINPRMQQETFQILLQTGLIFSLENGVFAMPLYSKTTLEYIDKHFSSTSACISFPNQSPFVEVSFPQSC